MSFIEDLGDQIREHLERDQTRINEEIGHYPAPIAGCDQQFNYLLAQRAALKEELVRLAALGKGTLAIGDAARSLAEFIRISTCLDAETKALLSRRLQAGTDCR
jgi:hypothetical protein